MSKIQDILESTAYVTENADHVRIDHERLADYAKTITPTHWVRSAPFPLHQLTEKARAQFALTFNSLSFSYWGDPSWRTTYQGSTCQRGTWSMIAAILNDKKLLDPGHQATITEEELARTLRGIPLLKERVRILNETGSVINEKYAGDVRNLIEASSGDAHALLERLIESFKHFQDNTTYKGKQIHFYKRAQATVQTLTGLGYKLEGELTALADYILPRKLREEGILAYSQELATIIDSKQPIPAKSNYEVEIRTATIQAVEQMKAHTTLTSADINDHLWLNGNPAKTEHHRTRTTDY